MKNTNTNNNNVYTPDVTYLYLLHARSNALLHAYTMAVIVDAATAAAVCLCCISRSFFLLWPYSSAEKRKEIHTKYQSDNLFASHSLFHFLIILFAVCNAHSLGVRRFHICTVCVVNMFDFFSPFLFFVSLSCHVIATLLSAKQF